MRNIFKIIYPLIAVMWSCIIQPGTLWSKDDIQNSGPGLSATIEEDSARVGDIVEIRFEYRLPEGANLPQETKIKGIEGLTPVDRHSEPGLIRIRFLVDTLDVWKTETLSLSYIDKNGNNKLLAADPVSLTVTSNLGDRPAEAELKPIQDIIPTSPIWLKYLPWAAEVLGTLLIISALFWWYERGRKGKAPVITPIPAHIRAKKEIEELEARRLFEKGNVKNFYFLFSEILRRYLASLRGFPAVELTTEEIARCIHSEQDRRLLTLLRQADMVKFASRIPLPAKKEEEVKMAISYIQETSPVSEAGQGKDMPRGTDQ
ncbi:MAG: hypothetical protein AVO38_13380 [delta proteobacterium ML8_D]|jgi:hypothetical protein|nr:MAG: hypothetical protein AVO38_13380 [delta proteobacterium ML8_D]